MPTVVYSQFAINHYRMEIIYREQVAAHIALTSLYPFIHHGRYDVLLNPIPYWSAECQPHLQSELKALKPTPLDIFPIRLLPTDCK